ncbi:MAG: hypothetical protein AAGL34_10190 [Bacteroidota bacterium]
MNFEERLTGGHPNSLGNTVSVVAEVLEKPSRFEAFFQCYFSMDEVVRLRVSNGMKRIAKEKPELLVPYLDRFLAEIAEIPQASTQWTLSQLFLMLEHSLSNSQKNQALVIMKNNLQHHSDWIVLCQTMETLGKWSKKDNSIKIWMLPELERLRQDRRKSVSKKAEKWLKVLV